VLSQPGAENTDAATVIQKLEKMAQDNPLFNNGLEMALGGYTEKARAHCEASIVGLMFVKEEDLQSREMKDKVKFRWKDIEVSCLLFLILVDL
jgi:hypothetical protein